MRILITGAAGFLGSHLTDLLLSQGHEIVGVDNFITGKEQNVAHLKGTAKFSFIKHDVIEALKVDGAIDRIYHMASPASPIGYVKHQVATLKVNSQGTWNLLELAVQKEARFLMASTSECYGDPAVNPQPETYWGNVNPIGLRSMYDEAKRFSEACTMAYHRERGADTRIIRIFNTYGPRMDPHDGRVVISFIRQALNQNAVDPGIRDRRPLRGGQDRHWNAIDHRSRRLSVRSHEQPRSMNGRVFRSRLVPKLFDDIHPIVSGQQARTRKERSPRILQARENARHGLADE